MEVTLEALAEEAEEANWSCSRRVLREGVEMGSVAKRVAGGTHGKVLAELVSMGVKVEERLGSEVGLAMRRPNKAEYGFKAALAFCAM